MVIYVKYWIFGVIEIDFIFGEVGDYLEFN